MRDRVNHFLQISSSAESRYSCYTGIQTPTTLSSTKPSWEMSLMLKAKFTATKLRSHTISVGCRWRWQHHSFNCQHDIILTFLHWFWLPQCKQLRATCYMLHGSAVNWCQVNPSHMQIWLPYSWHNSPSLMYRLTANHIHWTNKTYTAHDTVINLCRQCSNILHCAVTVSIVRIC